MGLLLKCHLIILKHMPTNHTASLHIHVGLNPTWANLNARKFISLHAEDRWFSPDTQVSSTTLELTTLILETLLKGHKTPLLNLTQF